MAPAAPGMAFAWPSTDGGYYDHWARVIVESGASGEAASREQHEIQFGVEGR